MGRIFQAYGELHLWGKDENGTPISGLLKDSPESHQSKPSGDLNRPLLMFWPNYHTNVLFIAFISQNILLQKIADIPLLIKALLKPNEWGISLKWDVISKSHLREAISQTGPRDAVVYKRPQKTETFHERTTKFFWVFNCFGLIIMKQVFGVIFPKMSAYGD